MLGSKNIKAIAVRGSQRCDWAHPRELVALAKQLSDKSFGPATAKYRELGTAAQPAGLQPPGRAADAQLSARQLSPAPRPCRPNSCPRRARKTRACCAACTIGCEHIYGLDGDDGSRRGVRMEYENLFALGRCAASAIRTSCWRPRSAATSWGWTRSAPGGTIAFAMECVERGLLDAPWLRFGDGEALLRAHRARSAAREGLGDAAGRRQPADGASDRPRLARLRAAGQGPGNPRLRTAGPANDGPGICRRHARRRPQPLAAPTKSIFPSSVDRRDPGAEAAALAVETEDKAALMDSLILCKFLRGVFVDFFAEAAEMLRLVTGWDVTPDELRATARRIVTAKKHFNILSGWRPAEDTLPERFLNDPLADDPTARLTPERLRQLIAAYNTARGWTSDGYPPPDEIAALSIGPSR